VWLQVRIGITLAILNIVLDVVLITWLQYGAVGAAIANTGTQLTYAFWLYVVVRELSGVSLPWQNIFMVMAIGLVSTLVVPWLILQWLPSVMGLFVAIVVSALLYGMGLWVTGLMTTLVANIPKPMRLFDKKFRRAK
jgi:peptidoglycan biosynthesis protein MviN/MurJ (putative lipid II flippase)